MLSLASCALALVLAQAADPPPPTPELSPRQERRLGLDYASDEPSAAEVQGEPAAHEATGESVQADENNQLLWAPRIILFPIRLVYEIPGQALRGTTWLVERYRVTDVYQQIFFNEDGTFGIFPTALLETGFGLNVGARLIYRNVFGHGEVLSVRAGYGGQFRQTLLGQFRSGALFGSRFRLELLGGNDARPRARFFGIGNASDIEQVPAGIPLNPVDNSSAVNGRYSELRTRAQADLRFYFSPSFSASLGLGWLDQSFGSCSGCARGGDVLTAPKTQAVNVRDVYDTSRLTGFDTGLTNLTYTLSLSYDSRAPLNDFIPKPTPSRGWRGTLYGGYTEGYSDDPSHFTRFGLDAARVFNVFRGDRTLTLRFYYETVVGSLGQIPFTSFPQLGGNFVLRGDNIGRYRDRNVASVSAEYMWSLNQNLSSFIFTDAGRVWRSPKDLELEGVHVGVGAGLQMHTLKAFLMRFTVGYNGETTRIALSIDPIYDISPRAEW